MTRRRTSFLIGIAAALGIAGLAAALALEPRAALVSYLAVVVTMSAIAAGALAVLMISYLVRGDWTDGLHVPLTAAALAMPIAGVLFVPVLIGIPWLYPWAQGEGVSGFRAFYLAPWFFALRTVSYFVIWTVLAVWVRTSWANPGRMLASASAGLIIYALTASLAGIDWLESLTPDFHSSIYGLLFLTFQMLTGLSFALVVALIPAGAPTFRYGPILLSALLLWAYNHAMQYIIIWSGNIPDEVAWYRDREEGAWGVTFWTLIVLQFVLPFFAMLSSAVRNRRAPLLGIAALTLALRFVEALVLAAPGADAAGAILVLSFPAAILAVTSIWAWGFLLLLQRVQSSALDTRALPDAFDAAGTPVPQQPSS